MFKTTMRRAILTGLGVLVTCATGALAEETPTLQPGVYVRATVPSHSPENFSTQMLKGILRDQNETSLTLVTSAGVASLEIPRQDILKLETYSGQRSRGKGALVGLGIGAGIGAMIGYGGGDDPSGLIMAMSAEGKAAVGAVAFGAVGALIGALANSGEKWETVPDSQIHLSFSNGGGRKSGIFLSARF